MIVNFGNCITFDKLFSIMFSMVFLGWFLLLCNNLSHVICQSFRMQNLTLFLNLITRYNFSKYEGVGKYTPTYILPWFFVSPLEWCYKLHAPQPLHSCLYICIWHDNVYLSESAGRYFGVVLCHLALQPRHAHHNILCSCLELTTPCLLP